MLKTAKSMGFVKGDYAINHLGWVHKLLSDVHTTTPTCEVWGYEHEFGSAYASNLTKITPEQAQLINKKRGF